MHDFELSYTVIKHSVTRAFRSKIEAQVYRTFIILAHYRFGTYFTF